MLDQIYKQLSLTQEKQDKYEEKERDKMSDQKTATELSNKILASSFHPGLTLFALEKTHR